jgi:hypothetical protein
MVFFPAEKSLTYSRGSSLSLSSQLGANPRGREGYGNGRVADRLTHVIRAGTLTLEGKEETVYDDVLQPIT